MQKRTHTKLSLYLAFFSLGFVAFETTLHNELSEGSKLQLVFGIVGLIYPVIAKRETLNPFKYRYMEITTNDIIFGFVLGVLAVVIQMVTNAFGAVSSIELAVYYISAACLEELFFRGFILEMLLKLKNVYVAATIDSLIFAAAHYNYYSMPNVLVSLFLWSFCICLVYVKTSLTATMIGHLLLNTLKAVMTLSYGVTL